MQVSVDEKKGTMTIVVPIQTPTPSASGKTLVIATTSGNRPSGVKYVHDGIPREIVIGLNAYFKA